MDYDELQNRFSHYFYLNKITHTHIILDGNGKWVLTKHHPPQQETKK